MLVYFYYKKNKAEKTLYILPFLIFLISIGSFVFHLKPNLITLLMDVVPIFLFSLSFIYLVNKNLLKISNFSNLSYLIFFSLTTFIVPPYLNFEFLNGSESYISNYLFLFFYSLIFYFRNYPERNLLLISFLIFNFALFFRTIDNEICQNYTNGTHFLWHMINSYLLFLLSYIFILRSIHNVKD